MSDILPYRAEYSKSNRASCKGCKLQISKDVLRLAVMVQSPFFDGKQPNWYHSNCFFLKQRPKTVGDIAHFDSLRCEDQDLITKKVVEGGGSAGGASTSAGGATPAPKSKAKTSRAKKRPAASSDSKGEFKMEYSKSGRAACRGCELKIAKDEVRVSKMDFESDEGRRYGGMPLWHHLECFATVREDLEFYDAGATIPGFDTLSEEDQALVKTKLPKTTPPTTVKVKDEVDGVSAPKKGKGKSENGNVKAEKNGNGTAQDTGTLAREQNKQMFKYRDLLKENLKKKSMTDLLSYNKQEIPAGEERILDRLSDIMTFGALQPCEKCKGGQLVYRSGVGYQCQGDLTEWVKCQDISLDPTRKPFKVPKALKEVDFLAKYKGKVTKRAIVRHQSSASTSTATSDTVDGGPKIQRAAPALYNMEVALLGKSMMDKKEEFKKEIASLGGKLVTKIHNKLAFVISTAEEVEKMSKRMEDVQEADIQVVSEDILEELKQTKLDGAAVVVKKKSICSWGSDPKTRFTVLDAKKSGSSQFAKSKSMFVKSGPSKVKLQLKGGAYVDPDSGIDHMAHVYKRKDVFYNAVLGLTDIQSGKNSYYKMQILESDKGSTYWLFRSWGRIGTTIGGNLCDKKPTLNDAIGTFKELYLEKTGNHWGEKFVKRPGLLHPIDIDYGEPTAVKTPLDVDAPEFIPGRAFHVTKTEGPVKMADSDLPCNLPKPVQDLVKMLFDVDAMKKVMLEFELDLEKMPLGKISQRQMKQAYELLTQLQQALIDNKPEPVFMDLSNRFYTLIPHDFGIDNPPLLKTYDQIKQKIDMVASLMDIEIAYKMLRSGSGDADEEHPVETHYKKLATDIAVLDRNTEEFEMLQRYVKNTHAATHTQFELEIEEIFKVERHNESKRYQPFKKALPNRTLLWHGSRVTNFAGILSQGLRIAPPEAPVTGYMFGKGIYFADMVSKSANYCCTSKSNPTGLLLLCEVALGKIAERHHAEAFSKPPAGYHCVKGVGMTEPDPTQTHTTADGVKVPLGTGIQEPKQSSLLYNEYIVYDTAQLQIQYLFKMKFNHKF